MSKLEGLRQEWDNCVEFAEEYLPIIYEDWCSDELDYKHIPLKVDGSLIADFDNEKKADLATGEVNCTANGDVTSIVFSPILFEKGPKELYSAIFHEICHIAALEEDKRTGNFNYEKYKKVGGHNKTWQKFADIFNNIKNSKGEKKFNIVKSYKPQDYFRGVKDFERKEDNMKKEIHSKRSEDNMRESLISNSKLIFTSEEDQKDYDSQIAIVKEAKRIGHKIIDDAIFQMAKAAEQFPDAIDGDPIWLLGSHLYGIEHADKLFEAYKSAKEALDNE